MIDPDGVEWELYHVNYDLVEKHGGGIEESQAHPPTTIAVIVGGKTTETISPTMLSRFRFICRRAVASIENRSASAAQTRHEHAVTPPSPGAWAARKAREAKAQYQCTEVEVP